MLEIFGNKVIFHINQQRLGAGPSADFCFISHRKRTCLYCVLHTEDSWTHWVDDCVIRRGNRPLALPGRDSRWRQFSQHLKVYRSTPYLSPPRSERWLRGFISVCGEKSMGTQSFFIALHYRVGFLPLYLLVTSDPSISPLHTSDHFSWTVPGFHDMVEKSRPGTIAQATLFQPGFFEPYGTATPSGE